MKPALLALLFAAIAAAEDAPATFPESEFADYDLDAVKAGEYVESESFVESKDANGKTVTSVSTKSRRACVKADKDKLWIEESTWEAGQRGPERVMLAEVERKSRKVVKAWESVKGAAGKEIKVTPPEAAPAKEKSSGAKQGVSEETLRLNGKNIGCHAFRLERQVGEAKAKVTTTTWFTRELPFHERLDDEELRKAIGIPDSMSKDLCYAQARAQVVIEEEGGKRTTRRATSWGADAKPTVKTK